MEVRGFIVPDSGAVERLVTGHRKYSTFEEAAAKTILVGSDLDNSAYVRYLPGAVAKGLLTERHIDQALRHVLRVRFRLGEFDPPELVPYRSSERGDRLSVASATGAARGARIDRAAPESGQLSSPGRGKDQDNRGPRAVCGLRADRSQLHRSVFHVRQASGWHQEARGLQHQSAVRTRQRHPRKRQPGSQLYRSRFVAKQADVCVLFVGINETLEREGIDRNFINLPPVQSQLIRRVLEANPPRLLSS